MLTSAVVGPQPDGAPADEQRPPRSRLCDRASGGQQIQRGEAYDELATLPGASAGRRHRPSVLLYQDADNRQSYAQAATVGAALGEQLENVWQDLGGDSRAVIADPHYDAAVQRLDTNVDATTRGGKFNGVRQEI